MSFTSYGHLANVPDRVKRLSFPPIGPYAAVAVVTFAVAIAALDARATYGARVTADEPQYLLTALSLAEDFDLDISDEIAERRYLPFHEIQLDQQTIDLTEDGQRLSPHDPLLPMILAPAMGLGGWQAAKVFLATIGAATACATLWFATRRLHAAVRPSAWVVGAAFSAPPLTAYSTQVYPEMPAALATVVGMIALTDPGRQRRSHWLAALAIVALPWFGVKYAPVAAVLAALLLWKLLRRHHRSHRVAITLALAFAGATYLAIHQRIYGGWTVYATGDHFADGEFQVVGPNANYTGRTRRLMGLLVDRGFGLIPWAPAFVLAPGALLVLVRHSRHRWLVLTTIAAAYATATWVALTMHGWWWPGRQLVVILPLVVAAVAFAADRIRILLIPAIIGFALGVFNWVWLVVEASTDQRTLIVDFEETSNPIYSATRHLFPDHRSMNSTDIVGTVAWAVVLAAVAFWMWRRAPEETT